MHVWLCDNAGPVWQAPCIIALGRELHNNVDLSNACGLEPSAVSSPVKVSFPACLHLVHEKLMGCPMFFHVWRSALGFHFSLECWNYSNIHKSFSSHTIKYCSAHSVNHTGDFTNFSDWWEVVMADRVTAYSVKRNACLDKPTAKTDDHVLSACYYQTHTEKNKTIWLILNLCLPDHGAGCQLTFFFFFLLWLQSEAACVGTCELCPVEWSSTICWVNLYRLHTTCSLCAVTGNSVSCSVVWSLARKRTDKTKLWQTAAGLRCQT